MKPLTEEQLSSVIKLREDECGLRIIGSLLGVSANRIKETLRNKRPDLVPTKKQAMAKFRRAF